MKYLLVFLIMLPFFLFYLIGFKQFKPEIFSKSFRLRVQSDKSCTTAVAAMILSPKVNLYHFSYFNGRIENLPGRDNQCHEIKNFSEIAFLIGSYFVKA